MGTQMRIHTRFQAFLDAFPREQVLLVTLEEMATDRDGLMRRLEDFLGIRHVNWSVLIPPDTKYHDMPSTSAVSIRDRCLVDVCGRGVAKAWEDLLMSYTGQTPMYLPEN